ncbi:helix-turn-helix transcriptional regulator [Glycomyces sp. NPDC047369]
MTHSPYISKVLFGRQIQQFRKRKGNMSVAEASRRMGMSESKYRKLESGTNDSLKLPDAYSATVVFGLTSEETQHLVALVEAADKHGWYHDYDVSQEFKQFIEMEGAASKLHIVELNIVYGLFQTEDYLEWLKSNRPPGGGGPDQGLRLHRQEAVLDSEGSPEIIYITDEAALRRQVGGPEVMRAQYRHLLQLNERDNIEMLVIPFAVGNYPSVFNRYQIMYFTAGVFPTTVYLESLHGSHYEDAEKVVKRHETAFDQTRQAPTAVPIKEFIDASNLLA